MLYRRRHSKYTATGKHSIVFIDYDATRIPHIANDDFSSYEVQPQIQNQPKEDLSFLHRTHACSNHYDFKQFKAIACYHLANISHIYQEKIEKLRDEVESKHQKKICLTHCSIRGERYSLGKT